MHKPLMTAYDPAVWLAENHNASTVSEKLQRHLDGIKNLSWNTFQI